MEVPKNVDNDVPHAFRHVSPIALPRPPWKGVSSRPNETVDPRCCKDSNRATRTVVTFSTRRKEKGRTNVRRLEDREYPSLETCDRRHLVSTTLFAKWERQQLKARAKDGVDVGRHEMSQPCSLSLRFPYDARKQSSTTSHDVSMCKALAHGPKHWTHEDSTINAPTQPGPHTYTSMWPNKSFRGVTAYFFKSTRTTLLCASLTLPCS
eukprot:scaffold900_cov399-Pavlova_lutheri.AAC.1